MRPTSCSRPLTSNGAPSSPPAPSAHTQLQIQDLLANGQGVARIDQLVVFVTEGLPGEEVQALITERKPKYAVAKAVQIDTPSPDRVASPCPVFPECGGCQVLHLRYAAQLAWKQRVLQEAFARIGGLSEVVVAPTVASPLIDGTRYRNKAALAVDGASADPAIGFYAVRSHRVVPIEQCPVLLPRLNDATAGTILWLRQHATLARSIRHLVLRTVNNGSGLVLSITTRARDDRLTASIAALRARVPQLTGIATSWHLVNENAIFGASMQTLWGSPRLRETVAGARFEFDIASFFQVNTGVLELIAQRVVERLANCSRVVDLYCGVGTFGVLLGRAGVSGTGVEAQARAVDDAAANAAANGVTNVAFERGQAEEAVTGARGRSLLASTDAVILDPPRRGCSPEVLAGIAAARVPRVLYLSCNPATLARDAKLLSAHGYRTGSVEPFDMFPHTGHVEALAEFQRDGIPIAPARKASNGG